MIVIRPASFEDAIWLSSRLRAEDKQEIETGTGRSSQEIVPLSFALSTECYTVRRAVGDKLLPDPVAIFGACPDATDPTRGIIWFLGTPDVRLCALSIVRESGYWLNHLSRPYGSGLFNYADSRNSLHLRWCQLTKFSLGEPVDINGVAFIPIHRAPRV